MKGTEVKKKFPKFAKRHKIQGSDYVFLAGKKIKILRSLTKTNS